MEFNLIAIEASRVLRADGYKQTNCSYDTLIILAKSICYPLFLRSLSGYPNQSLLTDGIKFIIPDITISTSVSSIIHLSTNGRIRDVREIKK